MTKLFPTTSLVFVLAFGLKLYFAIPTGYDLGGLILFLCAVVASMFSEAGEEVDFKIRTLKTRLDNESERLHGLAMNMASIEKMAKETNSAVHNMKQRIDVVEDQNKTGGGF